MLHLLGIRRKTPKPGMPGVLKTPEEQGSRCLLSFISKYHTLMPVARLASRSGF